MNKSILQRDVDMLHSPLIPSVVLFAVPLLLSGILQLLFNAADMIVVGKLVGPTALAAVGSTGSLIALFTNFFMGFSVGTGVIVARAFGSNDPDSVSKGVHTSMLLSTICGIFVGVIGVLFARPMLQLMGSPEDVIDQAELYLRIYFIGMPFSMMYNFAAAILRAVGDTRRPLYYLTAAGAANVAMNVFFVAVLRIEVAGVAWATTLSQLLALGLTLNCLLRTDRCIRLKIRKLALDIPSLKEIIRIGLPAGLQSTLFSISNVLIQSSVNSFLSTAMAANSAAGNIENFAYTIDHAMYQAAVTFTSQNVGAKQEERIRPIARTCIGINVLVGGIISGLALIFSYQLLSLYTSDPAVVAIGQMRMRVICLFIPVCGMMDCMVGILRGMGYSVMPMLVTLAGACGFRVVWIFTIFQAFHTLPVLYASYPISWILTFSVHYLCFRAALRKPRWQAARLCKKQEETVS